MSFSELIVVFIVAIVVLGPQKFPKALISTLKTFKSFKKSLNEIKEDFENKINLDENDEKNSQNNDKSIKNNTKPLTFEEFDAIKSKTLKNNQDFLKKSQNLGCFDKNLNDGFKKVDLKNNQPNEHLKNECLGKNRQKNENKNEKENQQKNPSQKINNQLKEQK